MKISFIIPSRNNKKYLEWAYNSIRKNQGNHEVEICVADDFSEDGTKEWCKQITAKDPQFKWIRNEGPERQGLVILNDKLINEVATNDLCIVYHADMYLCPGALGAIEKHMYEKVNLVSGKDGYIEREKTIVSLTRIEPPLHPPGPEKVLLACGIEPEEFDEYKLLDRVKFMQEKVGQPLNANTSPMPETTEGIFAPWAFWKKDFQEIGGHDPIFAPQSKEDTDIFNRFHLNGIKFVQTWEGFVYHMTCRGSRFADGAERNPNGEVFMKNRETDEWLKQNQKSTREFIRKWGHYCLHDKYMKPIVPPKYNVGIRVENCTPQLLEALEPWCDRIYVDLEEFVLYQMKEQPNTSFDLNKRLHGITENDKNDYDDILVEIDGNTFSNESFRHIQYLSEILANDEQIEPGTFGLGDIKITVNYLQTYEKDLILCKK